ncbi:phage protein [Brevibacillus borstelensis]
MKTDIKAEVRQALMENAALVSLLGKDKFGNVPIYTLKAADAEKYPRITMFEVDNWDAAFADDHPIMADVIVQVDIFSKASTSELAGEVDNTMKANGWSRRSAPDFYEVDTGVYHKATRYRRQFEEE